MDGKEYQLPVNNGLNSLHGGEVGFHNLFWKKETSSTSHIALSHVSENGTAGYPGTVITYVTYTLTDNNELLIEYKATTDQPTVVNLTHHSFFNLAGAGNGDILDHELQINADRFCVINDQLIPTGELCAVKGTPFDFTSPQKIGSRLGEQDPQLKNGSGYDHNWVLNKKDEHISLAASVRHPASGRVMEVWTTEPGLQFYSGNFLDGSDLGKGGKKYEYRTGFCLEAQHFPDSPNHPEFPTTVLLPGGEYTQKTLYRFLTN